MEKVYDLDVLLRDYRNRPAPAAGSLVTLTGIDGLDGYNPSNPVPDGDHPIAYVRVEPRAAEFASWSVPFRQNTPDNWEIDLNLPMLRLEDPFVASIDGTVVVGGVRIVSRLGEQSVWETALLRGDSLHHLEEFARSPQLMKDVRLVALHDGGIGVFTRPWGTPEERAQIGYTEVLSLEGLTTEVMAAAPHLVTQPVEGQWWGVNAAYDLSDGALGVLAHIARYQDGARQYYAVAFVFDRTSRSIVRGPRIIAERACFPPYPARRPDLENVVFPAWIDRAAGLLYCGLSDTAIGVMPIDDPFADGAL